MWVKGWVKLVTINSEGRVDSKLSCRAGTLSVCVTSEESGDQLLT